MKYTEIYGHEVMNASHQLLLSHTVMDPLVRFLAQYSPYLTHSVPPAEELDFDIFSFGFGDHLDL